MPMHLAFIMTILPIDTSEAEACLSICCAKMLNLFLTSILASSEQHASHESSAHDHEGHDK